MENSDSLMSMIREDKKISWVSEQLEDSFSQGISMRVKESKSDMEFYRLEPSEITTREKTKREKYETSRPYSEDEKIDLIKKALKRVFLELPVIQIAAINNLSELCGGIDSIEFIVPEEIEENLQEISKENHVINLTKAINEKELLANNYNSFIKELNE